MNKLLIFILISFLLNNCSLNKNSKLWNEKEKIENSNKNLKKILVEKERVINELNVSLKLDLSKIPNNQNDPLFTNFISSANQPNKKIIEDAVSALTNLGYNKTNCAKIVISIFEENHQELQLPELISKSLKKLGNKYE